MPLITDSGFIAAATVFTMAVLVGTLGFAMQARGRQQQRRIEHHRWNSEALHRQAAHGSALNLDAGRTLLQTAGGILLWTPVALLLPYYRMPLLLPVATLGPALALALVTGRIARRYRALLRPPAP